MPAGDKLAPVASPTRRIPLTRLTEPDAPFDVPLWTAAIGPKNTDYYLKRFEAQLTRGRRSSWNWAALIMTTPWLVYRRMPGWALAYLIAPWVVAPLLSFTVAIVARYVGSLGTMLALQLLIIAAGLSFLLIPPIAANSIYFKHCLELIQEEAFHAEDRDALLRQVAEAGGTRSGWILLAAFVGALALAIGLAFLIRRF
jgi:hypothetical protein